MGFNSGFKGLNIYLDSVLILLSHLGQGLPNDPDKGKPDPKI